MPDKIGRSHLVQIVFDGVVSMSGRYPDSYQIKQLPHGSRFLPEGCVDIPLQPIHCLAADGMPPHHIADKILGSPQLQSVRMLFPEIIQHFLQLAPIFSTQLQSTLHIDMHQLRSHILTDTSRQHYNA